MHKFILSKQVTHADLLIVQVFDIADCDNPWTVFVETVDPGNPIPRLPTFEKESQ